MKWNDAMYAVSQEEVKTDFEDKQAEKLEMKEWKL